jgi:hypothetical protein
VRFGDEFAPELVRFGDGFAPVSTVDDAATATAAAGASVPTFDFDLVVIDIVRCCDLIEWFRSR